MEIVFGWEESQLDKVEEPSQLTIAMPDWNDPESVKATLATAQQAKGAHGYTMLARRLTAYLNHQRIARELQRKASKTIQALNGFRSPAQIAGDKHRGISFAARKVFEGMSSSELRQQCKVYRINDKVLEDSELLGAVIEAAKNRN